MQATSNAARRDASAATFAQLFLREPLVPHQDRRWCGALIKEGHFTVPDGFGRTYDYDISLDGQRFLMIKEGGGADQTAAPPQVIVVQHWTEELKRLVPTK